MTRNSKLPGLAGLAVVMTMTACGGSEAPKTPLGASATGEAAPQMISGAAKLALDSGNALFRAKLHGEALKQYQRSAELAPEELAPLLGIMMVADVTGNANLAEATLPRIRRLNPAVADSAGVMPHSKIIEGHPPTAGPTPPAT